MNPYLAKMKALGSKNDPSYEPPKPSKPGFVSFDGAGGRPFSENGRDAVKAAMPPLPPLVQAVLDRWPGSIITAVRFSPDRKARVFKPGPGIWIGDDPERVCMKD
jgi:hypothetical protein